MSPSLGRGRSRSNRIEQLCAGQEHDSGAGERQRQAAPARIGFEKMAAALDRAESERVDHQPHLGAGLDHEQSGDSHAHRDKLIKPHANRAVPAVPD